MLTSGESRVILIMNVTHLKVLPLPLLTGCNSNRCKNGTSEYTRACHCSGHKDGPYRISGIEEGRRFVCTLWLVCQP